MIRTSRTRIISLMRRSFASSCSPSTTRPPGRSRTGGPANVRELPPDDTPKPNGWSTSGLARIVEEDGHLAAIGIGETEASGPLPAVAGWGRGERESAASKLDGPGVHLRGGVDLETDLHPVAGRSLAVAEAQLETAELKVHATVIAGHATKAEGRFVELRDAGWIRREQRQLADAAHLPHVGPTSRLFVTKPVTNSRAERRSRRPRATSRETQSARAGQQRTRRAPPPARTRPFAGVARRRPPRRRDHRPRP